MALYEWFDEVLRREELERAAWATEHDSWAAVLWRSKEPATGLPPEVLGLYRSAAAAMVAGEQERAVCLSAHLANAMTARYGELTVQVVPLGLAEGDQ